MPTLEVQVYDLAGKVAHQINEYEDALIRMEKSIRQSYNSPKSSDDEWELPVCCELPKSTLKYRIQNHNLNLYI